jgi:hypothetical protein
MDQQPHVAFPAPPDQVEEQRRARELEHRLRAMTEIARVASSRAVMHEALAIKHAAHWLGDWERQKGQRMHELSRILADPELHALIRGTPTLRRLFSRHVPPPLPKRPRVPNKRKSRAKPKPVEEAYFDMTDPKSWGFENLNVLDLLWPPREK